MTSKTTILTQSMRSKITLINVSISLWFLAFLHARAADLYVSTQGSDANPGTAAQPFRTITHGYAMAHAGDTVHVLPGVYTDYTSGWGIHLGASGTSTSPIILKSDVRGGAVIDGLNASDRNVGFYIDGNYNIVDGFEIRNGPKGGITIWANGNQIRNCNIHNNGNPASSSTDGRDGVYSSEGTAGNVYAANYIHDNGRSGSNLDHGLYICGKNEVVVNNILLANAACGLQVAGYTTVSNLLVDNNVFALNGTDGIILWQSLNGIAIKNNIFYQNGHYGIGSYAAAGTGIVVDHNLAYGNGYGNFNFTDGGSTYSYSLGTTLYSDPLFVNPAATAFDPHLSPGSPAIQSGLNLYAYFTTDLAGAARPVAGAWDLGVYVYAAVSGDTTPPMISFTSPINGASVTGSVAVSANASDDVAVIGVQFKLDGVNLGNEVLSAPYTVTWDSAQTANGTHTLSAVARDAAGNRSTAAVSVNVSNTSTARRGHKH